MQQTEQQQSQPNLEAEQSCQAPYGLCSRELPPGLVQVMQQNLAQSQDWQRLGHARKAD